MTIWGGSGHDGPMDCVKYAQLLGPHRELRLYTEDPATWSWHNVTKRIMMINSIMAKKETVLANLTQSSKKWNF